MFCQEISETFACWNSSLWGSVAWDAARSLWRRVWRRRDVALKPTFSDHFVGRSSLTPHWVERRWTPGYVWFPLEEVLPVSFRHTRSQKRTAIVYLSSCSHLLTLLLPIQILHTVPLHVMYTYVYMRIICMIHPPQVLYSTALYHPPASIRYHSSTFFFQLLSSFLAVWQVEQGKTGVQLPVSAYTTVQ